jgi:hypothetical protein
MLLIALSLALAAPSPSPAPPSPTPSKSEAPLKPVGVASTADVLEGRRKGDVLLWDNWYTITVNGKSHYAYYNERVEVRNGRVFYRYESWKSEEGYVNEERLGVLSEPNPDLVPMVFNYLSTYRSSETQIDGTAENVSSGRVLTVKISKGKAAQPSVRRNLPSKAIFSALFPVWLGARLPTLKEGKTVGFLAVPEDNLELGFQPSSGNVRLEPHDDVSRKTGTFRVSVSYRDLRSTWYVDKNGAAERMEMPGIKTVVERVTKQKAEKFLDE